MLKNWAEWNKIAREKLPHVICVGGEERAFVDDVVQTVRARVFAQGMSDFNYDKLSAKSSSVDAILACANTLPMMAEKRLVEVSDAEEIAKQDTDLLENYLTSPSPTTVLLLVVNKIDLRQKWQKRIDECGVLCDFHHLNDYEMEAIVRRRGEKFAVELAFDAAVALVLVVGNDLMLIDRALEKLSIAVGNRAVTTTDIGVHITNSRLEDAFAFAKAVAMFERKKALFMLARLKEAREVPLRLVGLLAWQLRQILRARALYDEGRSENDIGRMLSLYGDRLSSVIVATRMKSVVVHIERLSKLCALDHELKSSRVPPWLWLERVVMQLCPK